MFALLIITRILFIASMVFIIGYVFGGFSKKPALKVITRVAVILLVVFFISTNFIIRSSAGHSFGCHWGNHNESAWYSNDSSKQHQLYHDRPYQDTVSHQKSVQ